MFIKITDKIRNYVPKTAIDSELGKYSEEYFVLACLKHCLPAQFSNLRKAETPDLLVFDGSLGVEVVSAISTKERVITRESTKYRETTDEKKKEKYLNAVTKQGGDIKDKCIYYPIVTQDTIIKCIINVYNSKIDKTDSYLQQCSRIGLAIIVDVPLSLENIEWMEWFPEPKVFDMIILLHWKGFDLYDFNTKSYEHIIIDKNDRLALKKLGRMTAEGIIKEDDPEWE